MSALTVCRPDPAPEDIARLKASARPSDQSFAAFLDAGVPAALQRWLEEELARGRDPGVVLTVMIDGAASFTGSLLAEIVTDTECHVVSAANRFARAARASVRDHNAKG